MTRRHLSVALVVLGLLGAVPAMAQEQQRLKGITEVYVLIETLDDVSASCGVTESELRTAVNRELLDNGIRGS